MNATLYIGNLDIENIARAVGIDSLMDELIDRLEAAFVEFDPTQYQVPVRQGFSYRLPQTGLLEWMPILNTGSQMLMKVVGYHPRNPELGSLPTILSNFSLYDATNGNLLAILDGTFLTALRTGAASAVASRFLAPPESSRVGVIGCGAQAVTQLHALSRVFKIGEVSFFDTDPSAQASFRDRCWGLGDSIHFSESQLTDIVADADLLCVATSIEIGQGPVFKDLETRPHLHINAVGSDFPGKTELPLALLKRSYVTPDCCEQAMKEGECQQLSKEQVGKSLPELLRAGGNRKLRESTTVFDSTGWALEDYIVSQMFLEHANRLGIGQFLPASRRFQDPKDPYEFLVSKAKARSRVLG